MRSSQTSRSDRLVNELCGGQEYDKRIQKYEKQFGKIAASASRGLRPHDKAVATSEAGRQHPVLASGNDHRGRLGGLQPKPQIREGSAQVGPSRTRPAHATWLSVVGSSEFRREALWSTWEGKSSRTNLKTGLSRHSRERSIANNGRSGVRLYSGRNRNAPQPGLP